MTDTEFASKREALAAAFAAARFDERIPEEAGFSAVFESEIEPMMAAGAEFNLRVRAARLRRRRQAWAITGALLAVYIILYAFVGTPESVLRSKDAFQLVALAALGAHAWARYKRPDEQDENQKTVIGKVLERFGARLGVNAGAFDPRDSDTPVLPTFTSMKIPPEHVEGLFDGRMRFAAIRVRARVKAGKSSYESYAGWYFRIDLPFSFSGATVVRERTAGYQLRGPRKGALAPVSLESGDFDRVFEVFSSDQHEARLVLPPDVMLHLLAEEKRHQGKGGIMIGFSGSRAHVWLPSDRTALSRWEPLDPNAMIEALHGVFDEMARLRGFFRDIDVIAESEGFRAQAAKKTA